MEAATVITTRAVGALAVSLPAPMIEVLDADAAKLLDMPARVKIGLTGAL